MRIEHHLIEIDTGEGIATTAPTVNEHEERLPEDIRVFFQQLVPADVGYKHNDIHQRDCPPDEPQNAHSHLIAMLLGASENAPVVDGRPGLGHWQSLMLVELDGPLRRQVSLQIVGD